MENLLELLDREILETDRDYEYTRRWLEANRLMSARRFVCYDRDKHPMSAITGQIANLNNPNDLATFEYCMAYWERQPQMVGIGIVFGLDNENRNLLGIDLDNASEDIEKSMKVVKEFEGYKEISSSLHGIHLIFFASSSIINDKRGDNLKILANGDFMALTGIKLEKAPRIDALADQTKEFNEFYCNNFDAQITNDLLSMEQIDGGLNATFRSKTKKLSTLAQKYIEILNAHSDIFADLFKGEWEKKYKTIEDADDALCMELAFYTARNREVMNEIYMASALYRPVWNDFSLGYNYGQQVLNNAVESTTVCWSEDFSIVSGGGDIQNETAEGLKRFDDGRDYDLTETGNARRFVSYFSSVIKYDYTAKCFALFRNNKWMYDKDNLYTLQIIDKFVDYLKLDMINEKHDELKKKKRSNVEMLYKHAFKMSLMEEIKHHPEMEIDTNSFDSFDYLINTPTELVDLKNSKIFPCEKQYLQMMTAGCIYSYKEPTLWVKFLKETFGAEYMWVRKYIAYCLSGSVSEQIFLCIYGKGNNGKSVFTKTLAKVFGDYCSSVPVELFCGQKVDHADQHMDNIKNKRLVLASEPDHNVEIRGNFIKNWVGGGQVSARKLYGTPYQYNIKAKIIIESNTKPNVKDDSDGFYRRARFIHCRNNVPLEKIDYELADKLALEAPQILGMIIRDYQLYLSEGLEPTQDMIDIGKEYKKSNSVIQDFLESRTIEEETGKVNRKDMWDSYKTFCDYCDIDYNQRYSKGVFNKMLSDRYDIKRFNDGVYYIGLRLKATDYKGRVIDEEETIDPSTL